MHMHTASVPCRHHRRIKGFGTMEHSDDQQQALCHTEHVSGQSCTQRQGGHSERESWRIKSLQRKQERGMSKCLSACMSVCCWEKMAADSHYFCCQSQLGDDCNCLSNLGRGEARCKGENSVNTLLLLTLSDACCSSPAVLLLFGPKGYLQWHKTCWHLTSGCYNQDSAVEEYVWMKGVSIFLDHCNCFCSSFRTMSLVPYPMMVFFHMQILD